MRTRGKIPAALLLLSGVLLAPLLIVDVPPVLDYPNHLARFVLLAAGADDPALAPMFATHWAVIPNLAADVLAPPLLRRAAGPSRWTRAVGGILLLNLAGVVALHRALFGRRSFWPLASGLVAYNAGFLLGFLNWGIGCGLAMLAAACWLHWRERRPIASITAAAAMSVVLFFCHLMALVFFLVLIGSAEVVAIRRERRGLFRSASLLPVIAGAAGAGAADAAARRASSLVSVDSPGEAPAAGQPVHQLPAAARHNQRRTGRRAPSWGRRGHASDRASRRRAPFRHWRCWRSLTCCFPSI